MKGRAIVESLNCGIVESRPLRNLMLSGHEFSRKESFLNGLDREHRLLLLCAGTALDQSRIAEAGTILDDGIDWNYFIECCDRHRLLPLIYWSLKSRFRQRVPAEILETLRTRYLANLTTSIIQSRGLFRITTLLRDASIPVLAFKGPTLGALAYGNMALRQSGDLDILVLRRDIHRAAALLHSAGCRSYLPLPPDREPFYLQHHHEHLFFDDELRVSLDVHWALMPPYYSFSMDTRELMERSTTVLLDGEAIPTMCPEDLLLFLCLHGAKHEWENLGWICDIQELIRTQPHMDWEAIRRSARHYRLERILALGLELTRTLLGMKPPDTVLQVLRQRNDPTPRRLAAHVTRSLFHASRYISSESTPAPLPLILEETPFPPVVKGTPLPHYSKATPSPHYSEEPHSPHHSKATPSPHYSKATPSPPFLKATHSPPFLKATPSPPFLKGGQGGFPTDFTIFFIRCMDHWADRFRAVLEPFFAPTYYEYRAVRFPAALFFLYCLLRPVRLMIKYTLKLLPVRVP